MAGDAALPARLDPGSDSFEAWYAASLRPKLALAAREGRVNPLRAASLERAMANLFAPPKRPADVTQPRPRIEILVVRDCPNAGATRELVHKVARELGLAQKVEVVLVEGAEQAERHRFLGSPTVRVDGRDVEPGADERTDFSLSCRIYRTATGPSGHPDETLLRRAMHSRGG